jgi:hypothetical protein
MLPWLVVQGVELLEMKTNHEDGYYVRHEFVEFSSVCVERLPLPPPPSAEER